MKYAGAVLSLTLVGSSIVACAAGSNREGSSESTSGGAAKSSSKAGTGGAPSGAGSTGTGGAAASGPSGTGTTTGPSTGTGTASGMGGAPATTTSTGPSTGPSTTSGPIDFDGGWQIPDAGMTPTPVGDGGVGVVLDPGANAASPGAFGGPVKAGDAITLVYPPDGVVVPPNMDAIEFHFIPRPGQTLFKFSFQAPTTSMDVLRRLHPPERRLRLHPRPELLERSRELRPRHQARHLHGQRRRRAEPGDVGVSPQASIAFSQQDLTGGIYYWNDDGTIVRYDFGLPNVPPEQYMNAAQGGALFCVGCHVLSRQGTSLAVGKDIPAPAAYTVFDVLSEKPLVAAGQPLEGSASFFSFSPDGNYLLTSDGITVGMRRIADGTLLLPSVGSPGTMPDWAPDGLHLVYAQPATAAFFAVPGVQSAALSFLHFNGTTWDTPTTLVPFTTANNYYPTFSPTGDWVLYNASPADNESFGNAAAPAADADGGPPPDGELWAVSAQGGAPVRLSAASNPGALSWPKWAPVLQSYYGGQIMWLTFASARGYGLELGDGDQVQVWMAGFDPAKAAAGQDPSLPAFWFPFQSLTSGNHIAQWATTVPRQPCTQQSQCTGGDVCRDGFCIP